MASYPSSPQGRKIDSGDLRRRREEKLAGFLASATRALDEGQEFEQAQEALDEATLLDPNDGRVLALWERMDATRPARVDALLREAKQHMTARSPESAARFVDRAIALQPDSDAALRLRTDVDARLSAAVRARSVWRIAAGVVVAAALLTAATLTLSRSSGSNRAVREIVANAEEAMDLGRYQQAVALYTQALRLDPDDAGAAAGVSGAAAAREAERRATIEALSARARVSSQSSGSVQGAVLVDGGLEDAAAESPTDEAADDGTTTNEEDPDLAAAADPVRLAPAIPAPVRPAPVEAPSRDGSPAAAASAPTVVARLCNAGSTCGMLTVRVEPPATILFNGIVVGTGAQGVLRLPAGRHQIRLESEGYEFRRMVSIAEDAPATLNIDLEDEGLPRGPQ